MMAATLGGGINMESMPWITPLDPSYFSQHRHLCRLYGCSLVIQLTHNIDSNDAREEVYSQSLKAEVDAQSLWRFHRIF